MKAKKAAKSSRRAASAAAENYSGLQVGDEIPSLARGPIDRVRMARYAGATDDWNPMNLDDAAARLSGMPQAMAQPMIAGSWVGQMLGDWLQGGRVERLDLRFLKIVWPGDNITCHGRVIGLRREDARARVEVDAWAENQKGELVVRGLAQCELKPGAVLLRPPPSIVPRKLPPPMQMQRPEPEHHKPSKAAKSKKSKKPSSKKPAARAKAKPSRLAAKRAARKGGKR